MPISTSPILKSVFRRQRPKPSRESIHLPYEIVYGILSNLSLQDLWSARVLNQLFYQTSLDVIYAQFIKNSAIMMILPRLSETYSHNKPIEFRPEKNVDDAAMVKWSTNVSHDAMVEMVFYHELHPGSPTLINRIHFEFGDEGNSRSHQFRAAFVYGGGVSSWGFSSGRDGQLKIYSELLSRRCKGAFKTLFKTGMAMPRRGLHKEGYFTWNGEVCEVCLPLWDVIRIAK